MCVYMYIFIYIDTNKRTYMHMYVRTCKGTCFRPCAHVLAQGHVHGHVHIHIESSLTVVSVHYPHSKDKDVMCIDASCLQTVGGSSLDAFPIRRWRGKDFRGWLHSYPNLQNPLPFFCCCSGAAEAGFSILPSCVCTPPRPSPGGEGTPLCFARLQESILGITNWSR